MKQQVFSFGGPPRSSPSPQKRPAARKRRRAGRQTLSYLLLLLVGAAIIITLSLTVFFKVEAVEVTGVTKYAVQQIIDTSGIKEGDNLFRIKDKSVIKRLKETYTYVEGVNLKRVFPGRIVIEVAQAEPMGACTTAGGFVIVSESGRVLELGSQSVPEGAMVVSGMYFYEPQEGRVLGQGYPQDKEKEAELEEEGFRMLKNLVEAVEEVGFDNITMVDFSDRLNIVIAYEDRILIELGSEGDLPDKLFFVDKIIRENLEPDFRGTLDASMAKSGDVWMTPGDITEELEKRRQLASQYTVDPAQEDGEGNNAPAGPEYPDLAVVPGTERKETAGSSPSTEGSPSQGDDSHREPAVVPGTERKNTSGGTPESSSQAEQKEEPSSREEASSGGRVSMDEMPVVSGTGRSEADEN